MDPRMNVLLQDANLSALQKINMQKYVTQYGFTNAQAAVKKGISKRCRSDLKKPQLNLADACPELRFKDGDASNNFVQKQRKMREVHNTNMKNIQVGIEHAIKNDMLVRRMNMINKFMSGNATSQDVKQSAYNAMQTVLMSSVDTFQMRPVETSYMLLNMARNTLAGGGGVSRLGAIPIALELYRQLRVSYPWLPSLAGYENLPRDIFQNLSKWSASFQGNPTPTPPPTPMPTPTPAPTPTPTPTPTQPPTPGPRPPVTVDNIEEQVKKIERQREAILKNIVKTSNIAKTKEREEKQRDNVSLMNKVLGKRDELKQKLQQEVNVKNEQKQIESGEKQKLSNSPMNYDQALGLMRQNLTNAKQLLEDVQSKMDSIDVNMPVDTSRVSLLVNNKTRLETIIEEERSNINELLAATKDVRTSNEMKMKREELDRTQGGPGGFGHNIVP